MAQPFIQLRLVEDVAGVVSRIAVNAVHIRTYSKWQAPIPGDFREGIANSTIEMTNGDKFYVRETPSEIQSLLAAV